MRVLTRVEALEKARSDYLSQGYKSGTIPRLVADILFSEALAWLKAAGGGTPRLFATVSELRAECECWIESDKERPPGRRMGGRTKNYADNPSILNDSLVYDGLRSLRARLPLEMGVLLEGEGAKRLVVEGLGELLGGKGDGFGLRFEFQPVMEEGRTPAPTGPVGQAIEGAIAKHVPPEQRRGIKEAIASGAEPQVATIQINGKAYVIVFLAAAAGAFIYYAMRPRVHTPPPPPVQARAVPEHPAHVIPIVFPEHLNLTRSPTGDRPTVLPETRRCQGTPIEEKIEAYIVKKCDNCLVLCIAAGAIKDARTVVEINYGDGIVTRVPASSAVRFTAPFEAKSPPIDSAELYATEPVSGVLVYFLSANHFYDGDGPRTVTVRLLRDDSGAPSVLRVFSRKFFVGAKASVKTKGKYILPH